ncbi:MAG TPA: long-chain fatty acid--CoA ligase [Solirubrobacterales bacterium]|nr:long-chain fatty acid--CoA ligase [Solirubrobacterales bacterium]
MESPTAAARPARPGALDAATMCEAFQRTAAERADRPALRLKDSDFESTWAEFAATVRRRAAAFAALGVGRGDTVAFMLVNRPALHLCDAAAMHLGTTCFSIYNTSSVEQIEYLVGDAASRVVVTEPQFLDKLLEVRERVDTLEHIVVVGDAPEGTLSVTDFEALGGEGFDFDAAWRAVEPDDVLCLIYTSGTTGPPKGVQLTHGNMMSVWRSLDEVVDFTPAGRSISFLPTAHVADRWAQLYGSMVYGHTVHCCPDPREMVAYSIEVKPTVWGGVPRIWEKLKAALEAGFAAEQDEARRQVISTALEIGLERARAKQTGDIPDELERRWEAADEQVFSSIRAGLGLDECQWFAVGAAATPPEVILFFDAIGIEIAELWGMSETSAVSTLNPPGGIRVGTVGPPLPGVELKLADDGEILVRGPTVMKSYRNMPEKTAETFTDDGWLLTGDVGEFDADGYLRIVDRKKELIINAAGKNMSPANIEAKIKAACPLAAQVVAIGDHRPYNVALITLDPDACGAFAAKHGLDDASPAAMAREDIVGEAVAAGVEAGNASLSRVEQIKKFKLIEGEWPPGGQELTPTMKLKRKPIGDRYATEIEALYAS